MTMPITVVAPDSSMEDCVAQMEEWQVRRMLVVDAQGKLCGIVSQADIARTAPERETGELVKGVSRPTEHASELE